MPTEEDIKNAATYKAGIGWWLAFPNGQWKFYRKLPQGAKSVGGGKGSGYRSVQALEGNSIQTSKHLGIVDVTINRPSKSPGKVGAITFRPNTTARPGLSVERKGQMIKIKDVGLARTMPHGRILRKK